MPLTTHSVPVRAFCDFVARSGDLDLRFTPAPSPEEGMAGHRAVTFSRGGDYRAEVAVEGEIEGLRLRGRIDGVEGCGTILDEIKTHRGPVARIPAHHRALHWAQLRTYGALLGIAEGLETVTLRLCYYDIDRREETQEETTVAVTDLIEGLRVQVRTYKAWMAQLRAHAQRRDTVLDGLDFPHSPIRAGQARLMGAVERALLQGRPLMAQAPTGVGKTLGVLFPALKALGAGVIDRVFYLTARNAVQGEVRKALGSLAGDGRALPLRVLVLSAKQRACVHPDKACHGAACPLARGFFDRLPAARQAAWQRLTLGPMALADVAREHQVCPYFLGQEMARWSDLVLGDVNYYFDTHALLHALTEEAGWRVAVLVDEAHNLVNRAREMYSAALSQTRLREMARHADRSLQPALAAVDRAIEATGLWLEQHGQQPSQPSRDLREALTLAISRIGRWLGEDPGRGEAPFLEGYFELLALQRLIERFGDHALCEVTLGPPAADDLFHQPQTVFALHNVVPSPHLLPRLRTAHSTILFSATLQPPHYHRDLLGLPGDCDLCDVESAFLPQQLQVHAITGIATEYRRRARAATPIAALMQSVYENHPGNYLAFFSSFAYLDQVARALKARAPEIPITRQLPQMDARTRDAFLAGFTPQSRQIGFAVLGGSFGEGIDLPGRRLIGAFICNLGLTPFTNLNARMADQVDRWFGTGTGEDFIYLFPAVQKVVQAVGRVVRSHSDQGTVYLIDRRFGSGKVRALLPQAWGLTP